MSDLTREDLSKMVGESMQWLIDAHEEEDGAAFKAWSTIAWLVRTVDALEGRLAMLAEVATEPIRVHPRFSAAKGEGYPGPSGDTSSPENGDTPPQTEGSEGDVDD